MAECESWPVLWDGKTRSYRMDVDGTTQGRFAGSIVHYPDENIFEAWRYMSSGPVRIDDGNARSHADALALFYRRRSVPNPPPGWLRSRFMR